MLETNSIPRLSNIDPYYDLERKYLSAFENLCKIGFKVDYFGGMKSNGMDAIRYLSEEEKN